MSEDFDDDGISLETIGNEVTSGAAEDAASDLSDLNVLPRILRYAVLTLRRGSNIRHRLGAEIRVACEDIPLLAGWLKFPGPETGLPLALELDHRAVAEDRPELRSLSDCVRMLSLSVPRGTEELDDHQRIAKALLTAMRNLTTPMDEDLLAEVEHVAFGWAALQGCAHLIHTVGEGTAIVEAIAIGGRMARHRIQSAEEAIRASLVTAVAKKATDIDDVDDSEAAASTGHDGVVVAPISEEQMKSPKVKDIVKPLKHALNIALPLIIAPDLQVVRDRLLRQFPYAAEVIDFTLADMIGRSSVGFRPLLLVGPAGGGKTRFARALATELGVTMWRTDAARADGATFGGTDRRWYSAEPAHPFLAIAQASAANPIVLIDEIEKAATRSDYGRLWDTLLGFLEPESAARYPDPALQVALDLSHVSYIATANSVDPLPSPIRDRFRVIAFPKPREEDLRALVPKVLADLAAEQRLDPRWISDLNETELSLAAKFWRGGSVRRLRRVLEAIIRHRDANSSRN